MSDLRCRQCGARMQPAEQWCSLCHASRTLEPAAAAVPGPRSAESSAADQVATPPPPGRRRSKHAAPVDSKPRLGSKRTRLVTAAALVAVVGTGIAIGLSAGGGSAKPGQHVSPAGAPPSGTSFGVLPGSGTPSNIPLPGRVSH